jgi:hypothetical protein
MLWWITSNYIMKSKRKDYGTCIDTDSGDSAAGFDVRSMGDKQSKNNAYK